MVRKLAPAETKAVDAGPPPERLGVSALATMLHTNRQRLKNLLAEEGVERDDNNLYDTALACAAWERRRDHLASIGLATGRRHKEKGANQSISDLARAKARSEELRARRLEVMVANAEGKLIAYDQVAAAVEAFTATLKGSINAVADRAAPHLIGVKTAQAAREIIRAETDAALAQCARMLERLAERPNA